MFLADPNSNYPLMKIKMARGGSYQIARGGCCFLDDGLGRVCPTSEHKVQLSQYLGLNDII